MTGSRLEKLLEMEQAKPADAFIKFAIAQEYVNGQNDKMALPYFELLAEKYAHYVPLYYHFGKLCERSGELAKAMKLYTAGIVEAQKANDMKTARELQEALTLLADE